MSRSANETKCGRGCGVCGDAGANRRAREGAWHDADDSPFVEEPDGPEYCGPYCGCGDDTDARNWPESNHPPLAVPLGERIVVSDETFAELTERIRNPRPPSAALLALLKKSR